MNFLSMAAFVAGTVYIILGLYVLIMNPKQLMHRLFFLVSLCFAEWSMVDVFAFSAKSQEILFLTNSLSAFGYCCFGGFLLHFFLLLTDYTSLLRKLWVYPLLYVPGLVFLWREICHSLTVDYYVAGKLGWVAVPPYNSLWYDAYATYTIALVICSILILLRWKHNAYLEREKKQAVLIISSLIVASTLSVINEILLPLLGIYYMPGITTILILIWMVSVYYAIVNLKLMVPSGIIAAEEVLNKLTDLIIILDGHGRITRTNTVAEHTLGYLPDQLLNTDFFRLVSDDSVFRRVFEKLRRSSEYVGRQRADMVCSDGQRIPVDITVSSLHERYGGLISIIVVADDLRMELQLEKEILERRQLEETLWKTNEFLQEIDQQKNDFLSNISHEFRTPLTSVLGFASIVQKRFQDMVVPALPIDDLRIKRVSEQIIGNSNIIIEESKRLGKLVDDVLDIAKMEAGRIEMSAGMVDPGYIVERAVTATLPLYQFKDIQVHKQIEKDLPLICGDQDRLVQVMINLVSNAIKFTPHGQILCSVEMKDNEIIFSVQDSGIGIAEEDIIRIFEKFSQADKKTSGRQPGSGLGLPICRQIIEHHAGRLWVESSLESGSIFYFALPLGNDFLI